MTISTDVVGWMFLAVVLIALGAILAVYSIAKVAITGKAWVLERRETDGNVVPWHERSQR